MTYLDNSTTAQTYDDAAPRHSTIAPKTKLERISARARRQTEREASFCLAGLDAVITASSDADQALRLSATVFGVRGYATLPRYRRQYVLGYIHGAHDVLARKAARPTMLVPPPDARVPAQIRMLQPEATWHRHPHGGGWVASTAYVALSAYVGPGAVVHGIARVLDMARVYGGARVCESAELYGQAQAHGRAVIAGTTQMGGTSRASGDTLLTCGVFE